MSNIKKYKVGEIRGILEKIYNDPEIRKSVVPMFHSEPGLGKTAVIEQFMRDKGVYKPPFVLSQRMPFEVSGMAMVDKERNKMKYYNFDSLLELKDGDILFIDETYNANPNTLNAFLTFLESRIMISGQKLPDIMIVAATNRSTSPLTSQIKRRFLQYDIIFDNTSWEEYMFNKYNMPKRISSTLSVKIRDEKYKEYNYNTPADLDKATSMIIKDIPTPYDNQIKPVLELLVDNSLNEDVVNNKGEVIVAKNEKISWLKLIKMFKNEVTKE